MEAGDTEASPGMDAQARADEALRRFLPAQGPGVVRSHHVTALLVSCDGSPWLPRTLSGLAAQTRRPDAVISVDAQSRDDSAALLGGHVPEVRVIDRDGVAGAFRAAAGAQPGGSRDSAAWAAPDADEPVQWYWLLHDDSAADPGCLAALLEAADRWPAAHVLIPKTVAWSNHDRLVGIGNMWAPGTPVVERLEPGERDQGQYDVDRAVYGGETAGMLVRADTWRSLGGLNGRYDSWGSGADLCRRAWGSGHEVVFTPRAVLAHRQAGRLGVRRGEHPARRRRAARHGQLLLDLTQAPARALPWRWLRGWLSTAVRALALLLTREPEEAGGEAAGAWEALAHLGRIGAGRRELRRPPVQVTRRPPQVRARRGAVLGRALDSWNAARPGSVRSWRPGRDLRVPAALALALAAAAVLREPGQLFGAGSLSGGGLLPAPGGGEVLRAYLASWQDARFGAPSAQPAYLPLLAAASLPLLGSVDVLLRLVFTLAVPLAFLSAYASAGSTWPRRARTLLALTWAVLPAAAAAMSAGRLSTVALLLLGPPTARLLGAAVQAARTPGARLRPAIAAGTLLGVTAAFAPLVLPLVALAALLAWLGARLPRWPLESGLVVLGTAAVVVLLWTPRVVAAPWLLLSDLGRDDPTLAEPQAWVWGLSPGGPGSVAWSGLPLLVVALLVALLAGARPAVLAAVVAALVLVVSVAWTPAAVRALWPAADAAALWPGQQLLLAGGLLALGLAWLARGATVAAALATAGLLGSWVVLLVGWWMAPVVTTVGPESILPPVVALAEESTERPRGLVLTRDGDRVLYAVSTGSGTRLGDADALAAPEQDPAFAETVEDLVSGVGGDVEADLGRRAIRYVLLDGPSDDPIAATLDSSVGLRRIAEAEELALWLVSGQPSRAELVGRTDDPDVTIPVSTRPTSVDVIVHPEALLPRILLVSESADPGWQASIAGQPVVLSADSQGMVAGQVEASGRLVVAHRSPWSALAAGHLVVVALLLVLSLPKRRTLDPYRQGAP